jgi:rubredoxin
MEGQAMIEVGDLHFHKCGMDPGGDLDGQGCGYRFEHVRPDPGSMTDEEYDAHHTCPACGMGPWKWVWSAQGEQLWAAMGPEEREETAREIRRDRMINALINTIGRRLIR